MIAFPRVQTIYIYIYIYILVSTFASMHCIRGLGQLMDMAHNRTRVLALLQQQEERKKAAT